jgi:hypothetical protein
MNKLSFIILFVFSSLWANAQVDSKYLAGAVPEVNGKVQFSRSINTGNKYSETTLFETADKWIKDNYGKDKDSRILLSNAESKNIAISSQKDFVFKRNAFVLDKTTMAYQLILEIENSECKATIRGLKYTYPDFKEPEPAENLIADEVALGNGKLNRYYDKFRIYTVDSVNNIFDSLEKYLNGGVTAASPSQQPAATMVSATPVETAPVVSVSTVAPSDGSMPGFKKVDASKIPASMSGKGVLLSTGSSENITVIPAKWNGTSTLMDKVQTITNIEANQRLDNNTTYTIAFFTEMYEGELGKFKGSGNVDSKIKAAGLTPVTTPLGIPAFSEAWMIIECKMSGEIPSGDANSKTCLGEILNVWIK